MTDKIGNYIGDGYHHIEPNIFDFSEYDGISVHINKSITTETTYVTYHYNEKQIKLRFSTHESNSTKFGYCLNGHETTKDEILYHLGLKKREFVPETYFTIEWRYIKKTELHKYESTNKTLIELYKLGAGADISEYSGKLEMGTNRLIIGNTIEEKIKTKTNCFGQSVRIGNYKYKNIC